MTGGGYNGGKRYKNRVGEAASDQRLRPEPGRFDVIVLGAGITGVTTAYLLAKTGRKVQVIDRRSDAALETTYANGGQISVSHAEPWAHPGAPLQVLKWLAREGKSAVLLAPPGLEAVGVARRVALAMPQIGH